MLNHVALKSAEPLAPGYDIFRPETETVPFVFNSPHSGRNYSVQFLKQSRLSPHLLRRSEDALVDHLFNFVPSLGAPLLSATFPRAYVDVNREPFEFDPKVFEGPLPPTYNKQSMRVLAGLGTIARVVGAGLEIYRKPLSLEEGLWRISNFYLPYHRALRALIEQKYKAFETAILIDCHSMPSNFNNSSDNFRPDFVIGDRHGASAQSDMVDLLVHLLQVEGFNVARNTPYAGGYITEHYGDPSRNIHAIQVEINRSLYLNEDTLEPNEGFAALSSSLQHVFSCYVDQMSNRICAVQSAAE